METILKGTIKQELSFIIIIMLSCLRLSITQYQLLNQYMYVWIFLNVFGLNKRKNKFVLSPPALAKLNIASDVIVNNVGRSWRKFGRKLGLTEVHLDSIARKHPTDLMETAIELLKMWRKIKPEEGENELIKALRDCDLNLTADKVEERLEDQ